MLNGGHIVVQLAEILPVVSCQPLGNIDIMQILKNAHTKDISFLIILSMLRIKISIPIMDPVVICNFAMISDKPSLRFPFPDLQSMTFRSPISCNSCRISSAWFFPGRPSFGPDSRIP